MRPGRSVLRRLWPHGARRLRTAAEGGSGLQSLTDVAHTESTESTELMLLTPLTPLTPCEAYSVQESDPERSSPRGMIVHSDKRNAHPEDQRTRERRSFLWSSGPLGETFL